MTLRAEDVSWAAGGAPIVRGVTMRLPEQGVLGLVGPNGSGKSSLLRLLAGLRRGTGGAIYLEDRPIESLRRKEIARRLAHVEQQSDIDISLTAREVVALGRLPLRGAWNGWSTRDEDAVASALQRTDMIDRAAQPWSTLSGGERQRVVLARALVQDAPILVLDEPTSFLDLGHQMDVLELIAELRVERCLTVVCTLHDLTVAGQFADRIAIMDSGRLVAHGTPETILTPELISRHWGVDVRTEVHDDATVSVSVRRRTH